MAEKNAPRKAGTIDDLRDPFLAAVGAVDLALEQLNEIIDEIIDALRERTEEARSDASTRAEEARARLTKRREELRERAERGGTAQRLPEPGGARGGRAGATARADQEGSTGQEGSGEEDHQKVTEVIGGNAVATAAPADDLNTRVTIDSVRNQCARQFPVQQLAPLTARLLSAGPRRTASTSSTRRDGAHARGLLRSCDARGVPPPRGPRCEGQRRQWPPGCGAAAGPPGQARPGERRRR